MKYRVIPLLLALCLLSGCASPLIPNEYTVVTEHSDAVITSQSDALTAENYEELKYAILSFVEDGVSNGVIRSYRYDGELSKDAPAAAYDVWKNDPIGAYAVEYITTDSTLLLAYYEIHVNITYRENTMPIHEIPYVRGVRAAEDAIHEALPVLKSSLTLRISAYSDSMNWEQIVQEYCAAHPEIMVETPKVEWSVYPHSGAVRILDIRFRYEYQPMELAIKQTAVNSVLTSAANYVRYRHEDRAKAEMLVSYLLGRFEYREGTTSTQFYSLLCEGIANSQTFAAIFQLVCDRIGLECRTVYGNLNGESHDWNILKIDDSYYHVDLMRYVREGHNELVWYTDGDMEGYSWNRDEYPACTPPPEETEEGEEGEEGTEGEDGNFPADDTEVPPAQEDPTTPQTIPEDDRPSESDPETPTADAASPLP